MLRRLILALAAPLGLALPAGPELVCRAQQPETSSQHSKVEKALNAPTKVDFDDAGTEEAIKLLQKLHGISIRVENDVIPDDYRYYGITFKQQQGTLREALRAILHGTGLTFLPDGQSLLITTRKRAAGRVYRRVYPVIDLLGEGAGPDALDPKSLARTIMTLIAPGTWRLAGESGTISVLTAGKAKSLAVTHNALVHEQVGELLARRGRLQRTETPLRPRENKIIRALDSPIQLEFIETPLSDAVDFLRSRRIRVP